MHSATCHLQRDVLASLGTARGHVCMAANTRDVAGELQSKAVPAFRGAAADFRGDITFQHSRQHLQPLLAALFYRAPDCPDVRSRESTPLAIISLQHTCTCFIS